MQSNYKNAEVILIMATVRHIAYLERYKRSQYKIIKRYVNKLFNQIQNALTDVDINFTPTQQSVLRQVESALGDFGGEIKGRQQEILSDILKIESAFYQSTINSVLKEKKKLNVPDQDYLYQQNSSNQSINGMTYNQVQNNYLSFTNIAIISAVKSSFSLASQEQKKNDEREKLKQYLIAVQAQTLRNANTVISTGISQTADDIRDYVASNNDQIDYERYTAILDNKTTLLCRSRDGKVFKKGTGPTIPAHYNCRSRYVLVPNPDSLNADLPNQTEPSNQNEFLSKQPMSFLNEIMGPNRAKLFKDGNLDLEDFINDVNGSQYTLKQLLDKYPDAFEAAGIDTTSLNQST